MPTSPFLAGVVVCHQRLAGDKECGNSFPHEW